MHPPDLRELLALLPDDEGFVYFEDRESPWLLARRLDAPARLASLRRSEHAALLDRPLVSRLVAGCGDGCLRPGDLAPLAEPEAALAADAPAPATAAAAHAARLAAAAEWRACSISFTQWGPDLGDHSWHALQLSRPGGNLVLQLNFPQTHQADFARRVTPGLRKLLEVGHHPVRRSGPITMAWARLDLDPWGDEVLIEELQSDWFRMVAARIARLALVAPAGRELAALRAYERTVLRPYARDWDRALMLAVLIFARRELGARRVWLHRPETGRLLKRIRGVLPPASLYTRLPKRFRFRPVRAVPRLLARREGALKRLRAGGRPVFWRLDL
ncbi:hypothetical protein LNKW23_14010 [Paralimibaculum aggregatum]|uniref:DUF4123 domain-containing protein n=1 Tax=Paralimibaculum aggregatum TaxID=3036245 RepID=A0ABQ6LFT4_9RHOB|nr:hypothetical protein [Limibaculum sp. NKW23]GMG82188.1 hypothetical protein LNKW23_14010 [Limibaculum sp. NKW23]